jgi:hypothetical protein
MVCRLAGFCLDDAFIKMHSLVSRFAIIESPKRIQSISVFLAVYGLFK